MKKSVLYMTLILLMGAFLFMSNRCEIDSNIGTSEGIQIFSLSGFYDGIRVSSGIKVLITDDAEEIKVEWRGNHDPNVKVTISGNTLNINREVGRRKNNVKITVYVPNKDYKRVNCSSGSSVIFPAGFSTTDLELGCSSGAVIEGRVQAQAITAKLSSGSQVKLSGSCTNLSVSASSGSDARMWDLIAVNVKIDASSGSSVNVHAENQLEVSASSGSSIIYSGTPTVNSNTSSGASVKKK